MNNGLLGLDPGNVLGTVFNPYQWEEGYALLQSRQPSGTGAGALTGSDVWDKMSMNIVDNEDEIVIRETPSPSFGFIVKAGKYRIRAFCGCTMAEAVRARVLNVTDNTNVAICGGYSGTAGRTDTCTLMMEDVFWARGEKELRMEQASSNANGNSWARGIEAGSFANGGDLYEVHGVIELWRLADR